MIGIKKYLIGLAVLVMNCQVALGQGNNELIIPLSKVGEQGTLRVDIKRGSIAVVGNNRKDVLISYRSMTKKYDDEESKNGLKRISGGAVDLEVTEKNNVVEAISDSWNNGVNLTITVPRNFNLDLSTYNGGDIEVNDINGDITLENYNGEISAQKISGSVSANTYNGEIQVELLKVNPDTPMSYITYNGDVDITLPGTIKANLKMKTTSGEIYSGFDVSLVKNEPITKSESKSGTYKVYLDDWVKGAINGGGPELVMKNYNGDIYIRKQ